MKRSVIPIGIWLAALSSPLLLSSCGGGGGNDQAVTAVPAVVSIAAPNSAESASTVQFGNSTGVLAGLKYQWDFGDGSSSSEAAPSHSYSRGGDFEVLLRVSNAAGESRETRTKLTITNLANVRGLECSGPENTGWCWQSPRPTGNAIATVYFLDASTGWRGGDGGEIFATIDGGATWHRQKTGATGTILHFYFLDSKTGWALSSKSEVLRTGDGGATWAVSMFPKEFSVGAKDGRWGTTFMSARSAKDVYAMSEPDVVASSDGGVTWRRISGFAHLTPGGRIWRDEGQRLEVSNDGGLSFATVLEYPSGAHQCDRAFAGESSAAYRFSKDCSSGSLGSYYTTADGGVSWAKRDMIGPYYYESLFWISPDAQTLMSVYKDANPKIQGWWSVSSDAGQSWGQMGVTDVLTTRGVNLGESYSALRGGGVLRRVPRGDSAIREVSKDGRNWLPVEGCVWPNLLFEEGPANSFTCWKEVPRRPAFELIAVSNDLGQTWRPMDRMVDRSRVPDKNWVDYWWLWMGQRLMDFSDAKHGFMIDESGNGLSTVDGGASWQAKSLGLSKVRMLRFLGNQTAWMINAQGKMLKSLDGGQTWIENDGATFKGETQSPEVNYVALGFENESLGWYRRLNPLGDFKFTQYAVTHDGGVSWERVSFPLPYSIASMRLGSKAWLAISDDDSASPGPRTTALLVSRDSGKSWIVNNAPDRMRLPVFSDEATIWALSLGKLFKSEDFGVHWSEVSLPATNLGLNDVKFANAKVGWAVGDSGLILKTQDGGKTWYQQASGAVMTLRSILVADPKAVWLFGDDGVLATGTGGD